MRWATVLQQRWHVGLVTLGIAFLLWVGITPRVQARSNEAPTAALCPSGIITYVNYNATGANTGNSWNDAFTTLQDALTATDNCSTVREIWVAKGVYYPDEGTGQSNNSRIATFQLRHDVAIYGGFAGNEMFLAERNWQTNITVLSGDIDQNDLAKDSNGILTSPNNISGANTYHVVAANNITTTAILDGFTITGGKADGAQTTRCIMECGGGINNDLSSPTLRNLAIIGNYANNNGGGIYNLSSHPLLQNVAVQANYTGQYGAGVYNNASNPTMLNVLVSGNLSNSRGGAIHNNSSNPLIVNATISGNRALSRGGGIYNVSSNPSFKNVILWGNSATVNSEIENSNSSAPTFHYSVVKGSGGSSNWNTTFGIDGSNNLDADPQFTTVINPNNTPTRAGDLHLATGSPVADAGLSSANSTTLDLDNETRQQSAAIDLGAYESAHTAQITVTQALTPAVIEAQETVTYTIVVNNSGSAYAYQAKLTDTLPVSVTFVSWHTQPAGAAYAAATNRITWAGTIDASNAVTFTFSAKHIGNPNETITNTVTTSHPTGDDSATATFSVVPLPVVSIADTTSVEANAQATFTVTLATPTRKSVNLIYTTSDSSATAPADYTATTGSLIIPAGSQTGFITIPVVNDAIDENSETFAITVSDPVNATLANTTATATLVDDDTAGNLVAPATLTIQEPDQRALFTITLTSQPEAPVLVALTSGDATACSVPANVVLTPLNWQHGVTVTAVDDDVVDGDQACTIQTTVSSADPHYDGLAMNDVSVTVQSEDVAGVVLAPASQIVREPSHSALVTVTLTSQPMAPVQIDLASTTPTECSVPANITLTAANWRTGVPVTITAVDENFVDGDQLCTVQTTATSSDPNYHQIAVADLPVTVQDDDVAGVALTPTTLTIGEPNLAGSFSLQLTSQPHSAVTIKLTSSDTSECRLSTSTITLDETNWNVSALVPVTAADDEIDDGDQPCTIKSVVTSTDVSYAGIATDDVVITVQDDGDTAGIVLSTTTITLSEPSGTASYVVALTSQPTASVVMQLTTSDPGECTVPASVTLTTSNWRTGRNVTVTAVDDAIIDGPQSCLVQATATSNDVTYAGRSAPTVTATVTDNDTAGVVFVLDKVTMAEANDSAFLIAKLTSQPFAPVILTLTNNDPTECTLPSTITLNETNWQSGVGITILSVDDDLDDEAQLCTIQTTAVSSDNDYHALAIAETKVTVQDDETAAFAITPTTIAVSEPNSTATVAVALTSEPTATVTISLTSQDESECTGAAPLILDATNWQTGVTATIQAQDDRIDDGAQPCPLTLLAHSADGDYNGQSMTAATATVADDDTAGVIVTPEHLTVQEPAGAAIFTITLTSEPTAPVTVDLHSGDASECMAPAQVTLDAITWAQGVTVTVTAVDDAIDDSDQSCSVQTVVGSTDSSYAGIAAADVSVTVQDDGDTASVLVASTALTVSEPASSATYTVVLTSEPTASVTLSIAPASQQCRATAALVFTSNNWQQPQVVTVTAHDDAIVDGDRPCPLQTTASSVDTTYAGIAVAAVHVTVRDDGDSAGVTITPSTLLLSEPTGTATFMVALTSEPTATVTVEFTSDDPGECQAPGKLTIDATTWLAGVPVTVMAVDDALDDGDQPCHITLTTTSLDQTYHQRPIEPVALTVQDTDQVTMQVAIWPQSALVQLGETVTYTYRITNTGDVTLTVQAADNQLGALALSANRIAPKGVTQGVIKRTIQESDVPGPIQTTVVVTGIGELGTVVTANSSTAVNIKVMPQINVQLERLSPPNINEGAIVTYQLSITNTGFVTAVVESIQGAPEEVAVAAAASSTTCTAPLTLLPQKVHQCLLTWKAVKMNSTVVAFTVTLKLNGPLQSTATINDSATVVIDGPTQASARYLFLPIIKR